MDRGDFPLEFRKLPPRAPQAVFEIAVEVLSPNDGRRPLSQNSGISNKPGWVLGVTTLGRGIPWSPICPIQGGGLAVLALPSARH